MTNIVVPAPSFSLLNRSVGKELPVSQETILSNAIAASRYAQKRIEQINENSVIFPSENKSSFLSLHSNDLVIGELLGSGGFADVFSVDITSDSVSSTYTKKSYAMKVLKASLMEERRKYSHGAAYLAVEAQFLSTLNHPHIIQLVGTTAGDVQAKIATGKQTGYFLILEQVCETLSQRLKLWQTAADKYNGALYRATHDLRGGKRQALLADRLCVASDLVGVMKFLHDRNIVYRDLKPQNIGFDHSGVLKLFDFGLAKELKPNSKLMDGTYLITGLSGSRRYMAPEVALCQPYNLSVDVYSFGILLWEMSTLQKPFRFLSEEMHMRQVVLDGVRPDLQMKVPQRWPASLRNMLTQCWSKDTKVRPTFSQIQNILKIVTNYVKHRGSFRAKSIAPQLTGLDVQQ